jgi:O-antigen polymerase
MLFPIAFHNQVELPFHISSILWFLCLALIFIGLSHCGENNKVFKTTKYVKIFLAIFFSVLMLMAILFFIKTLNSGKEFVFATSANPERPADMMLPLENLYFNKLAEDFVMQNVFNLSNQNHSIEGIREFNNWQKKAIVGRPTEFNYKLLISSYQTLNDKPAACEAAKNAHYMYLSNVEFKRYYEYCNK